MNMMTKNSVKCGIRIDYNAKIEDERSSALIYSALYAAIA